MLYRLAILLIEKQHVLGGKGEHLAAIFPRGGVVAFLVVLASGQSRAKQAHRRMHTEHKTKPVSSRYTTSGN